MPELFIHNQKINSIFQLLGTKEDDISFSVGYAFSKCSFFLENFLNRLNLKSSLDLDKVTIHLQEYEKKKGFTDFELIQADDFHIIIEAKRGWIFPTEAQLSKYESRPRFKASKAKDKRIVIFNESNQAFCQANFDLPAINSVPIEVVSWNDVRGIANKSLSKGSHKEKNILKELITYLKIVGTMQNIDSNLVYVVSLSSKKPENWEINWQDIVNKKRFYFHPVGGGRGGWPNEPPNYIAFRYWGKLQSIHHIEEYEVITNPNDYIKEIPSEVWEKPHYLYTLGPPILPPKETKSGKKIVRSLRVWAMLDLLLTCTTIEEARDRTKERLDK